MDLTNNTVDGRFKIDRKIGKGSFGDVYIGQDIVKKHLVAIKAAPNDDPQKRNILHHEHEIYMELTKSKRSPLAPNVYWYGQNDTQSHSLIVMKYLGNSLEYLLHNNCAGKFSLKTTLMIAIQIFDLLKRLHSCNYVHRDIKPDNFLIGVGPEKSKIFVIDFGLAKRYKSVQNVHIRENADKRLTGTARYASINSHHRMELSRRDDLESLGYLIIYFLKGKLPWQGIPASTKQEKYSKIGLMKAEYPVEKLCEGLPEELTEYMKQVRNLDFKEKPDYYNLRSLFINLFNKMEYDYDYKYDWVSENNTYVGLSLAM
jgi:serine/threonine protein kinase